MSHTTVELGPLLSAVYSFSAILPAPPSAIEITCTESFLLNWAVSSNKFYKTTLLTMHDHEYRQPTL
jgi:hypothetical protein